ncbi:MAG: S8 family serine peptidase [Afipia sp.]
MSDRRDNSEQSGLPGSFLKQAGVALLAVLLCAVDVPDASAQFTSISRGPTIGPRVGPNINVGPRISIDPHVRYSPEIDYHRTDRPRRRPHRIIEVYDPPDVGGPPPPRRARKDPPRRSRSNVPAVADNTYVAKEVVIEVAGNPGEEAVNALARRHRLTRIQSQNVALLGSTFFRWRISDRRSVDQVVRELAGDGSVRSAQRNNIFRLQQATPKSDGNEGYAPAKLHLSEAHALSVGADVRVAVIDSGIDSDHPELAGSVIEKFDALGSKEGAHAHGTTIAGIIAAHQRLVGTAPAARLLAIRAFGEKKSGAESTSFVILRGLDYAVSHQAQVINMSFAGPHDPLLERGIAAAAARKIILVAAAGNAGPKSPPLYPGADRNVIAVTATDSSDRLFSGANQGAYVALAAPGVDILAAVPGGKYRISSGTSLSAAFVSGLAALMIARNPELTPGDLRLALESSARDLGPKGRDTQFGAGEVDALAAVSATAIPVTTASERDAAGR